MPQGLVFICKTKQELLKHECKTGDLNSIIRVEPKKLIYT